jgi:hypothetical protein
LIEYLLNLPWYTQLSGAFTILSAISSLVLGIADLRNDKSKLVKRLKWFSIYFTMATAVITLFLTQKSNYDSEQTKLAESRKADSVQRERFDSTLTAIGHTLAKQDMTLNKQALTIRKQDTTLTSTGHILEKTNSLMSKTNLLEDLALEREYPLLPATIDMDYQLTYSKTDFTKLCPTSLRNLAKGNDDQYHVTATTTDERAFLVEDQWTIFNFEIDTVKKIENSKRMFDNMLSASIVLNPIIFDIIFTRDSIKFVIHATDIEFKPVAKYPVNKFRSILNLVGKYCRLQLPLHPNATVTLNKILYKTSMLDLNFKLKNAGNRPHITGTHLDFILLIKKEDINIKVP